MIRVFQGRKPENDFIGGPYEVKNFQMERKIYRKGLYGRIRKGWWYGFLWRNGHRIVTQQGERFAVDRSDWTTLDNISQMYDIIYDEMVNASVAERLETSVFMNKKGEIVDEFYQFGRKVDTKLTHPEYCL